MRIVGMLVAVFALGHHVGCAGDIGDTCRIDSDCEPGLFCGEGSLCRIPFEGAGPGDTSGGDGAAVETCGEGAETKRVATMAIAKEGHGMAKLAPLANATLQKDLDDGKLVLERWTGTAIDGGEAWAVIGADGKPQCGTVVPGTFPMSVPTVSFFATVYDAEYDATAGRLTGRADKEAVLESLHPNIRNGIEPLIAEDVDTDGDGTPDQASVILEIGLAP